MTSPPEKRDFRQLVPVSFLLGAVTLSPLPFGSSEPHVIAVWVIVLALGLCSTLLVGRLPSSAPTCYGVLATVLALVCGYGLVLHEQLADHSFFAHAADPVWDAAARALGERNLPGAVTVARNAPFFALGRPLAYLSTLLLAFAVGGEPRTANLLLKAFGWSGFCYAAYGIISHVIDPALILWKAKEAYLTSVVGTFVNRNTAASYFAAALSVQATLVLQRNPRSLSMRRLQKASLPYAGMLLVTFVALLMTGSRAGLIIGVASLFMTITLQMKIVLLQRYRFLVFSLVFLGSILLLAQILGGTMNAHFDAKGLEDLDRLHIYQSTLRIIEDHFWLGTGLGTFPLVFPTYRNDGASLWGVVDRAHSTPLELASEVGVPLTLLNALAWGLALVHLFRGTFRSGTPGRICTASLGVALVGLAHSCVDFSLQIAGFGIPDFALVGCGLAQAGRSMTSGRSPEALDHARRHGAGPQPTQRILEKAD